MDKNFIKRMLDFSVRRLLLQTLLTNQAITPERDMAWPCCRCSCQERGASFGLSMDHLGQECFCHHRHSSRRPPWQFCRGLDVRRVDALHLMCFNIQIQSASHCGRLDCSSAHNLVVRRHQVLHHQASHLVVHEVPQQLIFARSLSKSSYSSSWELKAELKHVWVNATAMSKLPAVIMPNNPSSGSPLE